MITFIMLPSFHQNEELVDNLFCSNHKDMKLKYECENISALAPFWYLKNQTGLW